jgi:hypothetical protein
MNSNGEAKTEIRGKEASTSMTLIDDILGYDDKPNTGDSTAAARPVIIEGVIEVSVEDGEGGQRSFDYQVANIYDNPAGATQNKAKLKTTPKPKKELSFTARMNKLMLLKETQRNLTNDDDDDDDDNDELVLGEDEYESLLVSLKMDLPKISHQYWSKKRSADAIMRDYEDDGGDDFDDRNKSFSSLGEFMTSVIIDIWRHMPTVARLSLMSLMILSVFLVIMYNETDDKMTRRPPTVKQLSAAVQHMTGNSTDAIASGTTPSTGFSANHHMRDKNGTAYLRKAEDYLANVVYAPFANSTELNREHGVQVPAFFDPQYETPIFFHIPKSGGSSLEHVLGQCLGLVQASQFGEELAQTSDSMEIQVLPAEGSQYNYMYVNVDTFTPDGIQHAKQLGLMESDYADVIHTPYPFQVSQKLLSPATNNPNGGYKGRLFVLMRHPVDRAVSMYYHLRSATNEKTYDHTLQTYTLEQYAHLAQTENNWMTRTLCNVPPSRQLYPYHLAQAKILLKQKAVIGLTSRLEDSIERFEQYFGWMANIQDAKRDHEKCQTALLLEQNAATQIHPILERRSEVWTQLYRRNWFDIELYTYASELYRDQASWFV